MNLVSKVLSLFLISFYGFVFSEDLLDLSSVETKYGGVLGTRLLGLSPYSMPAGSSYCGYISFPAGFTLAGATTINVFIPVDRQIDLNGNILNLEGDLRLGRNASIVNNGTINGKDADGYTHAIMLSDTLEINSTIDFASDIVIDGNDNTLLLGPSAQLTVDNNVTVTLQNMIISGLSGTNINMGSGSKLALDNVIMWLTGDYEYTQGSMYFHHNVVIAGDGYTFKINSPDLSFIAEQSQLFIDHDVRLRYSQGTTTLLRMNNDSAYLYLNGGTLYADSGLMLTKGTIVVDAFTTLQAAANTISFGDPAGDAATTILMPETTALIKGQVALTTVENLGPQSHVMFYDGAAQVDLNSPVSVFCEKALLVKNLSATVPAGTYSSATANDLICKTVSTLNNKMNFIDSPPGDVEVNTTTTVLAGNLWLANNHRLHIDTTGGDVTFNGASHFIHCARESKDPTGVSKMILIDGGNKVKFTNVVFKDFSPQYIQLSGNSKVLFDDAATIEMSNNEAMDSSYTLSCNGKVTLNCFGNALNLSTASALDVLASSTLMIQDAWITGLGGTKLKMFGADSTLTLSNCAIVLGGNYSFTQGYLNVYEDVAITGTNVFAYHSPQIMTIFPYSQLRIDLNTTFSYDAGSTSANAGKDKLVMVDRTSQLYLDGCTLHVTTTGLQLTNGTVVLDHIVTAEGESVTTPFYLTDGNHAHDITMEIKPGSRLVENVVQVRL